MFLEGGSLDGRTIEAALCIIGAGPAGIAIARQFLNTGTSVVMIESGGLEPEEKVQSLSEGENTGAPYDPASSHLRCFGGTSYHWEGRCAPLEPIDFEARPWVKDSGWPIGLDELTPWYRQAAQLLDIGGDFSVTPPAFGAGSELAFHAWRLAGRVQFGTAFRGELQKAHNIRVILHASVVNIAADAHASRVTHLEAMTLEKQRFTVKAKHYVLACGGIENARLLLLSRDRVPAGLGNAGGMVGRYFMEHPNLRPAGTFYAFGRSELFRFLETVDFPADRTALLPNINPSPEAMRRHRLLNGALLFWILETESVPMESIPEEAAFLKNLLAGRNDPVFALPLHTRMEQAPNPDSRVALSDTRRDALGLPQLQLHWDLTEQDWLSAKTLCTLFAQAASAAGLGILHLNPWSESPAQYRKKVLMGYHHMGTTRMSADPRRGVVDTDCRMHGMENLHVAGSSVYPASGWANPTYTLLALALRLANRLKGMLA